MLGLFIDMPHKLISNLELNQYFYSNISIVDY
jgi:hypothetical protein